MSSHIGIAAAALLTALFAPPVFADAQQDLAQLPEAVRSTVDREASGGKVEEVEKVSDDGKLFKVEIRKDNKEHDLYIDASGKVVGRHVD